jgi:hypothetical protein
MKTHVLIQSTAPKHTSPERCNCCHNRVQIAIQKGTGYCSQWCEDPDKCSTVTKNVHDQYKEK